MGRLFPRSLAVLATVSCLFGGVALAQTVRLPRTGALPIYNYTGNNAKVIGTCFLVDRQLGWLCTAGHVLEQCLSDTNTVFVRVRLEHGSSVDPRTSRRFVECQVVACGYDYVAGRNGVALPGAGKPSTNDWAIIAPKDALDVKYFQQTTPVPFSAGLDENTLRKRRVNGRALGYPDGAVDPQPSDGPLAEFPREDGLWFGSFQVTGGYSGAPFYYAEGEGCGIVLAVADATYYHSVLLPSYMFIRNAAAQIEPTRRVRLIAASLTNNFATEVEEFAYELEADRALAELNAIEDWQVCFALGGAPDGARAARVIRSLLWDYVFNRRNWMVDEVFRGTNSALKSALVTSASELVDELRNSTNSIVARRFEFSMGVFASARAGVKGGYLKDVDRKLLSKARLDEIFVKATATPTSPLTKEDLQAVLIAAKYIPDSAAYPIALVQVNDEYEAKDRYAFALLALSRDLASTGPIETPGQLKSNVRFYAAYLEPRDILGVRDVVVQNRNGVGNPEMLAIIAGAKNMAEDLMNPSNPQ